MAVQHFLYAPFLKNLMNGNIPNLAAAEIKCALLYQNSVPATYVFDAKHADWADVKAFEVTDADYTAGGIIISNRVIALITTGALDNHAVLDTTLDPKETVFTANGDITASHAVIYYNGGATDAEKLLISCIDFAAAEASSAAAFKLTWHADGILATAPQA